MSSDAQSDAIAGNAITWVPGGITSSTIGLDMAAQRPLADDILTQQREIFRKSTLPNCAVSYFTELFGHTLTKRDIREVEGIILPKD